jgi:uroporphyrin-III C-methyltransferase
LIVVAFSIIQVFGELKDLADKITTAGLLSPTLMIVGKVVALSPLWSLSMQEASCLVKVK